MEDFIAKANYFGKNKIPFFFLIDFEMKKPIVLKLSELNKKNILIKINQFQNYRSIDELHHISIKAQPIDKKKYQKTFDKVKYHLQKGDTYLLNLTFATPVQVSNNLKEIFYRAQSVYKLFFQDKFTSFSPETFIKIQNNQIFSYPMKGTIDADIPNAEQTILSHPKETSEHNTIVDLIRNDLGKVAHNIQVPRFRFIQKINSFQKNILQVSSKISGDLANNWNQKLGEILYELLPAGSVSGAPKAKTLEIIAQAEREKRGYYTGIFGIFDGNSVDSAVNIRYIEKTKRGMFYRSGGGITAMSNLDDEYLELQQKIYVPTA